MKVNYKYAFVMAALACAAQAAAEVTIYEREGFRGRSVTTDRAIVDFSQRGLATHAASVDVRNERWEFCEESEFKGRCVVLRPGRYPSLASMGLNGHLASTREMSRDARNGDGHHGRANAPAQIVFYEHEGYRGQAFSSENPINNLHRNRFNDHASSAEVIGERWEVCQDAGFKGRCLILRPGRYPSLAAMGMNDRISSMRVVASNERIADHHYAPLPAGYESYEQDRPARRDYRRRQNERLYEANVTSVRAVLGTPEQRCWVESEQIPSERRRANVPGAIVGAIVGGILGHQVGGGRGQDVATAGGAVAGAAVGANVGRDRQEQTRDVQRCETVPNQARPDYWDVTYNFHGQEHRVQMTSPPGRTVTVNENGEPRE